MNDMTLDNIKNIKNKTPGNRMNEEQDLRKQEK